MMKTLKGYFYINTGYIGSQREESFNITVDDSVSGDSILEEMFDNFMYNIDKGWIIEEENIID